MSAPFATFVRVVAAALGAFLGFCLGNIIAYYSVDYGDVGSAAALILWVPVGVLTCSIGAYIIATKTLRRFAASQGNASNR